MNEIVADELNKIYGFIREELNPLFWNEQLQHRKKILCWQSQKSA